MEKYIGIGFVILCLAVLAGVIGVLGYQFHLDKEKVDISPAEAHINQSQNNSTNEWGESLTFFINLLILYLLSFVNTYYKLFTNS